MRFLKSGTALVAIVATSILMGCGGGAGAVDSTTAANYAGIYSVVASGGANCDITVTLTSTVPPTIFTTVQQGMVIGENNRAYFVCGNDLWLGQFTGNLDSSGASAGGTGHVDFTKYRNGQSASSTSGTLSGNILSGNGVVTNIDFYDSQGQNKFQALYPNVSVTTITSAYSTLAGNLTDGNGTSVAIDNSGVITGTSPLGTLAGQITNFNSQTGVHTVSITVTPTSGAPFGTTGVLGPFDSSSVANDYSHVLLALTGNGIGYFAVLSHP